MEEILRPSDHMDKILSELKELQTIDENYWDIQIQVDTKIFKSQRSFLAAHSKYFRDEFRRDSNKTKYTRDQPFILENIDASAFEVFFHFIYTYDVRVDDSNILQLLHVNDRLGLCNQHFKIKCFMYLFERSMPVNQLGQDPIHNTLDLLVYAHTKKGYKVFVDLLHYYIGQRLYHFSKDERLMKFSFENLNSLLDYGKNYILPLPGCADVLMNISFKWVKYDPRERTRYLRKLTNSIGLTYLSFGFGVESFCTLMETCYLNKDNKSLNMPIDTPMDIGHTDDDDALFIRDAIISFDFPNVREMQIDQWAYSSTYTIISNLKWKIGVGRNSLGLIPSLLCGGTDLISVSGCCVSAVFTVTSYKEVKFETEIKFRILGHISGYREFYRTANNTLKWNDLINPENGYIKDDGSISLTVEVHADVPFRKINMKSY